MRWKIALLLLPVLVFAVIALGWRWNWFSGTSAPPAIPVEALADYLPGDAAGVISLKVQQLLQAPGAASLGPSLCKLASRAGVDLAWAATADIDFTNLEEVRVVLPANAAARPLWFLRGAIDPTRFQKGPTGLRVRPEHGGRLWEHQGQQTGHWELYAGPDYLIVAPPAQMAQWLAAAASGATASTQAPAADLLPKVDRTQPFWLAVSFAALGPVQQPENFSLRLLLTPVVRHARTVAGGLSAGKALQGELTFTAADEQQAEALEQGLKNIQLVAEGASVLLEVDFQPLLHFIGSGTTERHGTTVTLRCSSADR
jgi:hypothetical protein